MGRADWSAQALRDLAHQLDWLAARNPSAARRLAEEVARSARLAADEPGLGFRLGRADLRVMLTRRHRYRLVYQPAQGGIRVLRFLHPRQAP